MARRFRFSGVPGRGPGDPWFRVGTVDVDTTLLVVGVCVAMWIPLAILYPDLSLALRFEPQAVLHGEVWRVVTWPFSAGAGFWPALTLLFFWYFGRQLEEGLGRRRMAEFLAVLALVLGALGLVISLAFSTPNPVMSGLDSIQLIVVLLFIAENPHVRFFFDIPGWVFGVAIVLIQALQWISLLDVGGGYYLLLLLAGLVAGALVARGFGMLQDYARIPRLSLRRKPRAPKPRRSRSGAGEVVAGPWAGSSNTQSSDRAKLDALLEKIHESGMASLSKAELKQLEVLRKRIRGE